MKFRVCVYRDIRCDVRVCGREVRVRSLWRYGWRSVEAAKPDVVSSMLPFGSGHWNMLSTQLCPCSVSERAVGVIKDKARSC